jgi:cytochrome oxidase Cu insertion factor (SCO1/SenC/PrrC family)
MNPWLGTVLGLGAALVAAANAAPAPEEKTGLKVGEKAPEFTLKDQAGTERSLRDLLKGGPVALVFYRSASW